MHDPDIQGRVLRLALKIQGDQRNRDSTVTMIVMTTFWRAMSVLIATGQLQQLVIVL